jgi:hypothetical protein
MRGSLSIEAKDRSLSLAEEEDGLDVILKKLLGG